MTTPKSGRNEVSVDKTTKQELEVTVQRMKRERAAKPDTVFLEVLEDNELLVSIKVRAVNMSLRDNTTVELWRYRYALPIYKNGDPS